MVDIQYILCAAGDGVRFQELLPMPKATIRLNGKLLLEWAVESLPLHAGDTLIFLTQKAHGLRVRMEKIFLEKYPVVNIQWVELEARTRGQLETAYLAKDLLDKNKPIAIFNCDTYFQSKALLPAMFDTSIEGIIPCSEEPGTHWSFCQIDGANNVLDIREKERISPWATVGLYFFRDTRKFLERTQEALTETHKEYFVAPLYQKYIAAGEKIVITRANPFKPMGTPEQIETYWKVSPKALQQQNSPKKTLVIDLDNTITIDDARPYSEKLPNTAVIEKMRLYKEKGYNIVIYTARRMRTFNNDEASIVANIADVTLQWLRKHNVPFDGLKFGKPYAENAFYVDDRCIRPNEFLELSEAAIFNLFDANSEDLCKMP